MGQITLSINGEKHAVDVSPDTPLLWALRDHLDMVGTKYGCGVGLCGSCTVLIDGEAVRACTMPVEALENVEITTIEGFHPAGGHPVQRAWQEEDVAQCGYCQGGQVLAAAALLKTNPDPSDEEIEDAMGGNICRCGTYPRIRKAVKLAARYASEEGGEA
ncbi:MAG: (2Fe-2S)-binding protein [Xanthomonadales bacterium]|jgi:isoquinoline 1-oxidoreductase alpha subunit|nr:(2Fe-2S)-binding protein [Xanthomonadales bacterium]